LFGCLGVLLFCVVGYSSARRAFAPSFLIFLIHYLLLTLCGFMSPPSRRLDLFFYPFFTWPCLFYVFIVGYFMY
jgi:hypothetical protein